MWRSGFLLVAFAVTFASTEFTAVDYKECGGDYKAVRIQPCPQLPCIFKKGKELMLEVDFDAAQSFSKLDMKLRGELSPGVWLPFPGFKKDACRYGGLTCPLESGKPYTLKATLKVQAAFPTVNATVEWSMKGDGSTTIFCFTVPVRLAD